MTNFNLFGIFQNDAVGAIALHSFILGYYNVAKHKNDFERFPKISYLFYVLPIVYHSDSLSAFRSSNELYSAITKDHGIILELQERANKLAPKTFDALNIAFSKKILTINKSNLTIELIHGFQSKKLPLFLSMNSSENSVKRIQDCAFRLGGMFAKRNPNNIQMELNILF